MFKTRYYPAILLVIIAFLFPLKALATAPSVSTDLDGDGLSNQDEASIYHTDPTKFDTDGDGYGDGDEIAHDYDPNVNSPDQVTRHIEVSLKDQTLTYFVGPYGIKTVKISSGDRLHPTPPGTYIIDKKLDVNLYKGTDHGRSYYYPNTKWNMRFLQSRAGNYYIHGAYWHNKFGTPVSHGCINVSYKDMEPLYQWTSVGTQVIIK